MTINYAKSSCMCIGPRCDINCANIVSLSGESIFRVREMRYLGIFLTRSSVFSCSINFARRSFYRCANAIFGKVARLASQETILQLIKTKCVPMLLYGLEVCPLKQRDIRSLDFCVNKFLVKLFRTSDINVVEVCRDMFNFDLPITLANRTGKFMDKYAIL